jgi:excisionase family DNA binding protein
MEKDYYSVEEAAEKIGVHPKTVRRYIYAGKLEAQKIAGQWRVYNYAIDHYLNSCEKSNSKNEVSHDDFCVFMDSNYFDSDEKLQVCSIVDYYVESSKEVKPIATIVMDIVTDFENDQGKCRFNYVFDHVENKARFIFWGNATFISAVVDALKKFE